MGASSIALMHSSLRHVHADGRLAFGTLASAAALQLAVSSRDQAPRALTDPWQPACCPPGSGLLTSCCQTAVGGLLWSAAEQRFLDRILERKQNMSASPRASVHCASVLEPKCEARDRH